MLCKGHVVTLLINMHDGMGTVDTGKTRCETVGIPKAVLDLKY